MYNSIQVFQKLIQISFASLRKKLKFFNEQQQETYCTCNLANFLNGSLNNKWSSHLPRMDYWEFNLKRRFIYRELIPGSFIKQKIEEFYSEN